MTIAVVAVTLLFAAPLHAGTDAAGPPQLAQAPPTQRLRMPDLRRRTLNDAYEILSRYHRKPRVEQGPSDLPRGLIYAQEPAPGTDLAAIRVIVLHVSEGSRPPSEFPSGRVTRQLRMPDLRRQTQRDAIAVLSRYERKPRIEQGPSDLPTGLVYAQEPAPGTDLATVREIVLHVSGGSKSPPEFPPERLTLRMPDLRRHSLNDAFEILSKYRRKPRVEQGSSDLPKGLVFDQEPPPGTDLATVREIVLHVSEGSKAAPEFPPERLTLRMPDLRRHSLNDAFEILSKYRRKPRVEQGSSDLPKGLVYAQEPPPGTDLATVREIVLHVSGGSKPAPEFPPERLTLRMPDLRRHSLNDAFEILSKYRRKPRAEQGSSDLPKGLVFDQEPQPGTDLATVREIVLHISSGVKPEAPTVTSPPRLLMPDVRRRSLKDATGILSKYDRKPRVEQGTSDLVEGLVYAQEPPPGTDLATVRVIVLHVSSGVKPESPTVTVPPRLLMPDVRKRSLKNAVGILSKYDRKPRVEQGTSDLVEGLVFAQEPPPGTDLATVRVIVLHVSNGVKPEAPPVTAPPRLLMPDVRKRSLKNAVGILSKYDRKPRVEQGSSDLTEGLVYAQEPPPGTDLATVRVIVLHVSSGVKPEPPTVTAPPRLLMPDVRRQSLKSAFAALSRYRGEPRVEQGNSDLAKGLVYDQEPPPGTDLATVRDVVFHVSDGARPSLPPTYPTYAPPTYPTAALPTYPTSAPPTPPTPQSPAHRTFPPPTHFIPSPVHPTTPSPTQPTPPPLTQPTFPLPLQLTASSPPQPGPPSPPQPTPPPRSILLWGAAAAIVTTSMLAAAQVARHLRWKRVSKVKVSLDLAGVSSPSALKMAAPSIGLQAHLEMGNASPLGPIPVKTEEQS